MYVGIDVCLKSYFYDEFINELFKCHSIGCYEW